MNHAMRLFIFLLMIAGASANEVIPYLPYEFDPKRWPEAHLRLSQQGTLKDVFDSGLRPYRFPSLEKSTLEVKHLNLAIHLASEKVLPQIGAELIRLKPFDDGAISTMEGFTPKLTLAQAREEMLRWLPYAANARTEADLEDYLKAVEADFLDFDDPYRGISHGCSVKWKEPKWKISGGGPQCTIWFRKTANPTHPLRVHFKISWGSNRLPRDSRRYRVPIPPPPGYEHVSMEAPKNFGPDSAADILRAQGVDIGQSPEAREKWRREAEAAGHVFPDTPPPKPSPSAPPPAAVEAPSSFPWRTVAGIVVLLIAAVFAWRKLRGKSQAA